MTTVSKALEDASTRLEAAEIPTARLDASLLLADILAMGREKLLLNQDNILKSEDIKDFERAVKRRALHEPIAYILGKKEFWSLDFFVTRDTLIPRPDSETLIEAAVKRLKDKAGIFSILDIGTGSGCLLIALMKEFHLVSGVGVDNNEGALQVARKNAALHTVSDRAVFVKSNWCDAIDGTFDLIISNPPYIAEMDRASLMQDVVNFEPQQALFAGADGLDAYRVLAPQVASRLAKGGTCMLEVGIGQAKSVMKLLEEQGLRVSAPENDLQGIARVVIAENIL